MAAYTAPEKTRDLDGMLVALVGGSGFFGRHIAQELLARGHEVIALARKMTVAPWFVTDADVASVRKHFTDYQVAEIVLHACNAAYLDRVTEVSQLPVEKPLFELKP